MTIQLKIPLFILSSEDGAFLLKDELFREGFENVEVYSSAEDISLAVHKSSPPNVVLSKRGFEGILPSNEIIDFLALLLKINKTRIIYFTDNTEDEAIKFLVSKNQYDIHLSNMDKGAIKEAILNVNKFTDIKDLLGGYNIETKELLRPKINELIAFNRTFIDFINSKSVDEITALIYDNSSKIVETGLILEELNELVLSLEQELYISNINLKTINRTVEEVRSKNILLEQRLAEIDNALDKKAKEFADLAAANENLQEINNNLLEKTEKYYQNIFSTVDLRLFECTFNKIILFKEYSYPEYFNTFLSSFLLTLRDKHKVQLIVFEKENDITPKFYKGFKILTDSSYYQPDENILSLCVNNELLNNIIKNKGNFDFIVILDKLYSKFELYRGYAVSKFYTIRKPQDVKLFNIPSDYCFSKYDKDYPVGFQLQHRDNFSSIRNDRIKASVFKPLIDKLMNSLE